MNKEEIIKLYKQSIDKKRTEIISALTAISLFLTGTSCIVSRDRLINKERVYQTRICTYNEYYNTTNYHYEELPEQDELHSIVIRKVTPWVKDKSEAIRTVTAYKINNITFDKLTYKGNYKRVIPNLESETFNEYKYKNELRDIDRYEETHYEVVEIIQNKDKYTEIPKTVSIDTILMLLSEMVIYLFILKMNDGPLYETIITDIYEINKYKNKTKKLQK